MKLLSSIAVAMLLSTQAQAGVKPLTADEALATGIRLAMSEDASEFREFGLLSVIAVSCVDSKEYKLSQSGIEIAEKFVGMTNVFMFEEGVRKVSQEKADEYAAGVGLAIDMFFAAESAELGCAGAKMIAAPFFAE